jgi:hypothetical protein
MNIYDFREEKITTGILFNENLPTIIVLERAVEEHGRQFCIFNNVKSRTDVT